jgi:hypothetical protein
VEHVDHLMLFPRSSCRWNVTCLFFLLFGGHTWIFHQRQFHNFSLQVTR